MSLLEHHARSLAPVFQAPPADHALTTPEPSTAGAQTGPAVESVPRVQLPDDAAGSVFAPVGSFLAADPNVAEATAYGQDSPTVLVSVPLSRAVLEAACMNATGEQEPGLSPVTAEQISSWSDDQIRSWAIGEALDEGAGAAMNTVEGWQNPHAETGASAASGSMYDLVSDRIGRAFGFDTDQAEISAHDQAATDDLGSAAAGDDLTDAHQDVHQAVHQDDDADGWEL